MTMSSQWIHDERTPTGLGQIITLTPTELRRESKGALGGGLQVIIPVQALRGFYSVAYQYVSVTGSSRGAGPSQFLVSWTGADGVVKSDTWMVDVSAPTFRKLLEGLATLKPDANLLGLPSDEAHRRLGKTSLKKVQSMTIAIVLGVVVSLTLCLGTIVVFTVMK